MIRRVGGTFRFGEFELDVAAFTLRREGTAVRLEKIPMEVLVLLVERAGSLVARDSIHAALWGPDVFLDRDAAINTAMRKIRKALGDDVDRPRWVETVVGKAIGSSDRSFRKRRTRSGRLHSIGSRAG